MKTINEKIDHLFSKINWKDSQLDAEAISIMNSLKSEIEEEKMNFFKSTIKGIRERLSKDANEGNSRWLHTYEDAPHASQCEIEGYDWALNDILEEVNKIVKGEK